MSDSYDFNNYICGKNQVAVKSAQHLALAQGETQLFFWGNRGLGKSHLLQASCQLAAKNHQSVCYLSASQLTGHTPDSLLGLEQIELICLDDIDLILIDNDWELALFNLINQVRQNHHRMILSAKKPLDEISIKLPDLRSRLAWGPVFQLHELNDSQKKQALCQRAKQNGLELPDKVANYLIAHYPRDMFSLFEQFDQLDKASLALQRRLSIPLIKTVFDKE